MSLSGDGITDSTFVSLEVSPNSTFNEFGQFKWRMQTLDWGDTATLTIKRILGPDQNVGTDVITSTAQIDSSSIFDPNPGNDLAVETTSVLDPADDDVFSDGFEGQ